MNIYSGLCAGKVRKEKMKKTTVLFVVMIAVGVLCFADQEEIDMYEYLYNVSISHAAKLDILQNMAEGEYSGAGEFYTRALRRLIADYNNIKDVTERHAADEQVTILSKLIGNERYSQAAPDLWLVVDGFAAPLVKAEALMALGKIHTDMYLPQVIRVLESLNTTPTADRLYGERVAFGAILALEKFQDPSGYLPVYFASIGWYSDRIKSQANRSLPLIAEDPTPFMMEVIKGPGHNYYAKNAALRSMEAAKVDNKNKAEVAVAALTEGWRGATTDVQLRVTLADMRKLAINMINRYKTDDESVYPLLARSYTQGIDADEKLSAIAALASLGTEESAQRLSNFLMTLNNRRLNNVTTREDEQMVRAIIPALGQAAQIVSRPALEAVGASSWTPAVRALADDALSKLP